MSMEKEEGRPNRIKTPEGHTPPTEYPQFGVRQVDVAPGQKYTAAEYLSDDVRFQTQEEAQDFIDAQKRNGFHGVLTLREWKKVGNSEMGNPAERIDCN